MHHYYSWYTLTVFLYVLLTEIKYDKNVQSLLPPGSLHLVKLALYPLNSDFLSFLQFLAPIILPSL